MLFITNLYLILFVVAKMQKTIYADVLFKIFELQSDLLKFIRLVNVKVYQMY